MQNRCSNNCIKHKAGFTLVEVLLVVGILIALLALSVVLVSNHFADLRLKEMDSKAEIIFTAAQNRLSVLRANGSQHRYQLGSKETNGVTQLGYVPMDADESIVTEDTLVFVTSSDKNRAYAAAADILPQGAVDFALWDNHWIIEYEPSSGRVYAVFYSEEVDLDSVSDLTAYRYTQTRRSRGGYIGYYGGDISLDSMVTKLSPFLVIDNAEKLTVTFQCVSPDSRPLKFTVHVSDGTTTVDVPVEPIPKGKSYQYVWVMDDLSSEKTRFASQFPTLDAGKNISISVTADSDNDMIDSDVSKPEITNSLFGYSSENTDGTTALILCARHLQNLDAATSKVHSGITRAEQKQDISFADDPTTELDWYSVYQDMAFIPIDNPNLVYYNGSHVKDNTPYQNTIRRLTTVDFGAGSGLFAKIYKGDYENICLTGALVTGNQYVGGLAGQVTGDTVLKNCRVYLDENAGDLSNKDKIWISGNYAGGLVGYLAENSSLTVKSSFASTVIEGEAGAAGLVACAKGDVLVETSYSDCYITADNTAGLVISDRVVTVSDCYSAGYQAADNDAAGLVLGRATMSRSYTVCSYDRVGGTLHTTASSSASDAVQVYYLAASGERISRLDHTVEKIYTDLSKRDEMVALLGDKFTSTTGADKYSHPYNLRGQGLSAYSYPGLSGIPHYGDWKADFESGQLVYFEDYGNGRYGFFGANMDTLLDHSEDGVSYVKGDGYAVVCDSSNAADTFAVTVNGTSYTLRKDQAHTVQSGSSTYYLYPLPKEVLDTLPAADVFYIQATIRAQDSTESRTAWFNPHFAKMLNSNQTSTAPETVYVRSARQLHMLSLYYGDYRELTKDSTFMQEMDICYQGPDAYQWDTYYKETVTHQIPIGVNEDQAFIAKYNGNYKTIYNLDILTEDESQYWVGLFGWVHGTGELSNIVFVADSDGTTMQGGSVNYDGGISRPGLMTFHGALAGRNDGVITNCAVAGYTTDLNVYNGSEVFLGGLVGGNYGSVYNSSVVGLLTTMNINHSYTYVGGFVGVNYGSVGRSYAIGAFRVEASKGSLTQLSGFAGQNNMGTVTNSYCATSLVAAGTAETSAFTPVGGLVHNSHYLANGAYYLAGNLYAFQSSPEDTEGEPMLDADFELKHSFSDFGMASNAYMHRNTEETDYLYPAIVKDASGNYVHYGDWIVAVDLGKLGMFYWELEEEGSNDGIHFSYIGIKDSGEAINGSNLCTSHEDGGRITAYGYGYFFRGSDDPGISMTGMSASAVDALLRDGNVERELHAQMPGYSFVAYVTGADTNYLKPVGSDANLECTVDGYVFTVSPFFADSMSHSTWRAPNANVPYDLSKTPGDEANAYQVRSPVQLQFINWNWNQQDATTSIMASNYTNANIVTRYTYLRYLRYNGGINNESEDTNSGYNFYWNQSHDLNFKHTPEGNNTFTPIGNMYDEGRSEGTACVTMAYFAGSYNGQDYTLKNLEISSSAACVGLFGITMEARLESIAIYSDQSNIIQVTGGDSDQWYCIGGLVGYAGRGTVSGAEIVNCSIAGYRIWDYRTAYCNWGGANIGGLIGSTNMDISGCTAVTDITIALSYDHGHTNARVGGLIGGLRSTLSNSYAGGTIKSIVNNQGAGHGDHTNVWVGGIVGGIVMRDKGNFSQVVGSVDVPAYVRNCYSYVQLPAAGNDNIHNQVRSSEPIVSVGELQSSSFVNYCTNQSVFVYNSYCLTDCVTLSDNYSTYSTLADNRWDEFTTEGVTQSDGGYTDNARYVYFYNDRSPYLAYEEMCTVLKDYLNNGADGPYGMVTTEENNAPIPGKYTFPAGADYLDGRDYPFPTILTQMDRFSVNAVVGDTVNVHYGRWPIRGYNWAQYETELDVLIHDDETALDAVHYPEQQITLLIGKDVLEDDRNLTVSDFHYYDSDGREVAAADSPAIVTVIKDLQQITDPSDPLYEMYKVTVTVQPQKTGTVDILPVKAGKDYFNNALFVKVSANMIIEAVPELVDQCRGDETLVTFKAYNTDPYNRKELTDAVQWSIRIPQEDQTVADMTQEKLAPNQVKVTGYDSGVTFLQVEAKYFEDGNTEPTADSRLLVDVITRNGVVGLSSGGKVYNEAPIGFGGDGSSVVAQGRPGGNGAAAFLYANNGLDRFVLTGLKVNNVPIDKAGYSLGPVVTEGDYQYREILIAGEYAEAVDLDITVTRSGETYHLFLKGVTLKKSYQVIFDFNNGDLTENRVVSVSEGQQLLAASVPAAGTYANHRFLYWADENGNQVSFPMDVSAHITLTAKWQETFTVVFDAGEGGSFGAGFAGTGGVFNADRTKWTVTMDKGQTLAVDDFPDGKSVLSNSDSKMRFAGWYNGADQQNSAVNGSVTLTAKWRSRVKIYFNTIGGTMRNYSDLQTETAGLRYYIEVDYGSDLALPSSNNLTFTQTVNAQKVGNVPLTHSFRYWVDADGNQVSNITNVTEDVILTAVWDYQMVHVYNWKGWDYSTVQLRLQSDSYYTSTSNLWNLDSSDTVTAGGDSLTYVIDYSITSSNGRNLLTIKSGMFDENGVYKPVVVVV